MGFILSIIALLIFIFVFILFFIFNLVVNVKNKKWYKLTSTRNTLLSRDVDIMGNFIFKDLWNYLLSKGGYSFGRLGETLSSVFGKKLEEKSLTIGGYLIAYCINIVDFTSWRKGGHCKNSIQTDEEIEKFINR